MTTKIDTNETELRAKKRKIDNAKIYTDCFASAALTIHNLHGHGQLLDCPTVMSELIDSAKQLNNGNLSEIEQMLMTQAKTLDYLFYDSLNKLSGIDMINQIQVFTDIAFRSQTQCRKTLAVLAELKHPRRATFIKQQNNAITQQVNNAVKSKPEHFENSKKVANELLSEVNHATLDIRGTSEAIGINQKVGAMEAVNRRENP